MGPEDENQDSNYNANHGVEEYESRVDDALTSVPDEDSSDDTHEEGE